MMGVDQSPHGLAADFGDGVEVSDGAPLGCAGVNTGDPGVADQEPGVVDVPAPVGLDVGVDLIAHLLQLGFTGGGQVMVVRAHRTLRLFAVVPIEWPSGRSPRLSSVESRPIAGGQSVTWQ